MADMTFWTVSYGRIYDRGEVACGTQAYWTEEECYQAIRDDLIEDAQNGLLEEEEEIKERLVQIAAMDHKQLLVAATDDEDYPVAVNIEQHTLVPRDLGSVDKIEEFLK